MDAQTRAILEQINDNDGPALHELSVEHARDALKELDLQTAAPRSELHRCEDRIIPGVNGNIPVRIYWPRLLEQDELLPVLLFIHGGGYALGDMDSHDNIAGYLCKHADIIVVSVDYRLAPEYKFPSGVEDCYAALCWVADNVSEINGDATRLAVLGDSAGGTFSAVLCQQAKARKGPDIACQVLLYPLVSMDLNADYPSRREFAENHFLTMEALAWISNIYFSDPENEISDTRASPILTHDLQGLPPALLITAGYDPLRDEGEHYADRLRKAGVEVQYKCFDSTIHGFLSFGGVLEIAIDGLNYVVKYLRHILHT